MKIGDYVELVTLPVDTRKNWHKDRCKYYGVRPPRMKVTDIFSDNAINSKTTCCQQGFYLPSSMYREYTNHDLIQMKIKK